MKPILEIDNFKLAFHGPAGRGTQTFAPASKSFPRFSKIKALLQPV